MGGGEPPRARARACGGCQVTHGFAHCCCRYYYICRVAHQLAIFHVQPNGTLVGGGHHPLAPKSNARNLTLDVTGNHLLVASQDANCVEVFRIDAETGTLTKTDSAHAPCAADVAVV
jgi:6-phosphogluconolactonase